MPTPVTQGTPRTGGGGTPSSTPRLIRPPSLTLGTRPQDLKHRPVGTPMSGPRPGAAGSQAGTPSSQHRAIGQHQQQMQQQHAAQQPPGPSIHQRLAKMFGDEPHFLETGPSNRLTLSLASGISEEIDFALDRLLTTTYHEPDFVHFDKFPGMLDALLVLVRSYAEATLAASRSAGPSKDRFLMHLFSDARRDDAKRRALEAALVIRNVANTNANHYALRSSKRVQATVHLALDLAYLDRDEDAELLLYILEIAEVIAPNTVLSPTPKRPPGDDEEDDNDPRWQAELKRVAEVVKLGTNMVNALSHLILSTDRALVLGAFRVLAALGTSTINRPLLAETTLKGGEVDLPLERALELLPLDDSDLVLPVLDYTYAVTSHPSCATALCTRPDLGHLLRLLLALSRHRFGDQPLPLRIMDWPSSDWFWSHRAEKDAAAAKLAREHQPGQRVPFDTSRTKLSDKDLAEIVDMPEPRRTMVWMRYVFEADPDSDVQQVDLWTAYKSQFEPHQKNVPIVAASDVIKMSQDAFPEAMPMVVERNKDRLFVIRGMRVRERSDMSAFFACKWEGCTHHASSTSESLYAHIVSAHVSSSVAPHTCRWHTCHQTLTSAHDLAFHLRTHVPVYNANARLAGRPGSPNAHNVVVKDAGSRPLNTLAGTRLAPPGGGDGWGVQGIGYTALLIVRNLARTVAAAVCEGLGRQDETEDRREAREEGLFGRFVEADRLAARRAGIHLTDRSATAGGDASVAADTVMALEGVLLRWASLDGVMAAVMGDILGYIEAMSRALADADKPPVATNDDVQAMQE